MILGAVLRVQKIFKCPLRVAISTDRCSRKSHNNSARRFRDLGTGILKITQPLRPQVYSPNVMVRVYRELFPFLNMEASKQPGKDSR